MMQIKERPKCFFQFEIIIKCLIELFLLPLNNYVTGLPTAIVNIYLFIVEMESVFYRRQIVTFKVDPRTISVKNIMRVFFWTRRHNYYFTMFFN